MLYPFDKINAEEKSAYYYLFSLFMSNSSAESVDKSPLGQFIQAAGISVNAQESFAVWPEVSVFRDRVGILKKQGPQEVYAYMSVLVNEVARELGLQKGDYLSYTELPKISPELTDPNLTHPRQIKEKLFRLRGESLSKEDKKLYSVIQAIFNGKTEMLIRMGRSLFIVDIKMNGKFLKARQQRLKMLQNLYCSDLIRSEFGFDFFPQGGVITVGARINRPDVEWRQCVALAERFMGKDSRLTQAMGLMLSEADRRGEVPDEEQELAEVIPLYSSVA